MTAPEHEEYEFGSWRIDASGRVLRRGGETISLTPRVFDTLLFFVRNPGRLLEKNELMLAIWPDTHARRMVSRVRKLAGGWGV